MINKIECSLEKVTHILHIADIHLRNWKRHREYREVFAKLYDAAKLLPTGSIITVGGDIVHAKTDMSPELISIVSEFFDNLANIAPTIVITGNHDSNLNNNHRLDALTPIVEANKHPNLFYLRDSGCYRIGDLAISVMSLLDDPSKYVLADQVDLEGVNKTIAMYHGTIANSTVDSGLQLAHGLAWETFAGFDIVLLGDIHKRQVFSKTEPLMFYPGSLVQQNFGESFSGHGYAVVDVNDVNCTFHDIENQYGFYTVDVDKGVLPPNLPITSKTAVRVRYKNTTPGQLKRVLASIRKLYSNGDVVVSNQDNTSRGGSGELEGGVYQGDVRNIQTQQQLLLDHLKNSNVAQSSIDTILKLHENLAKQLPASEVVRGVLWRPKKFKFSNMFSYGEDNTIDFDKLGGVCGLFAPNHAGKSAILDALCFCLFDQTPRASKADQILNNKSDWFSCELNFELNDIDYFVSKKATPYRSGPLKGRLRVDIDFWMVDEDGNKVSLNGEQRRDTDKNIQRFVGTLNDFILTSLSVQGNSSNFIEKTQGERKELLANFLDLSIFDQLGELASKEVKSATVLLDEYSKRNFEQVLGDAEREYESCTARNDQTQADLDQVKSQLKAKALELNQLNMALVPCIADGLDILKLTEEEEQNGLLLVEVEQTLTKQLELVQRDASLLVECKRELDETESKFDMQLYQEYTAKSLERVKARGQLDSLKLVMAAKLDKLAKLKVYEYDPNCKFCMSNVFVKDAMETRSQLAADKTLVLNLDAQLASLDSFLKENEGIDRMSGEYSTRQLKTATAERDCERTMAVMNKLQHERDAIQRKGEEIAREIKTYHDNVEIVKKNLVLTDQIAVLDEQIDALQHKLDELNKQSTQLQSSMSLHQKTIEDSVKSIEHMDELTDQLAAYELYTRAISRDGIPFQLISQAVPFIQDYVNNILGQVVDFSVILETDGKNVNTYIKYDDTRWPLELASGMERFIASLAIRIALIKTTKLPKPDFIAIDEGLGVLDSTNMNSMHMFFTYLKDVFKFSLVISHIDVIRDMVDNILTIDRQKDFSHIQC